MYDVVAVCCSVLQCASHVLQYVTVCCSVLQCVAVCCSVLQFVAAHFIMGTSSGGALKVYSYIIIYEYILRAGPIYRGGPYIYEYILRAGPLRYIHIS